MVKKITEVRKDYGSKCETVCVCAEKFLHWVLCTLSEDCLWPVTDLNDRPLAETYAALEKPSLAKGKSLDGGSALAACSAGSKDCALDDWGNFGELKEELQGQAKQLDRSVKPLC